MAHCKRKYADKANRSEGQQEGPEEAEVCVQANEKAAEVQRIWKNAQERPADTILEKLVPFAKYDMDCLHVSVVSRHPHNLSEDQRQWIFSLTKANMERVYSSAWGWHDKKKLKELQDESGRYLLALGDDSKPFGFLLFRYTIEFETPSVYIWEIQLEEGCRGKGLGKHLMRLAEMIAIQSNTPSVALCVQDDNTGAKAFYNRLGYSQDERYDTSDLGEGYSMFVKSFKK